MMNHRSPPTTNVFDLLLLLTHFIMAWLRHPFSFRMIDPLDAWLRGRTGKYGNLFRIKFFRLKWLFVNDEALAQRILEPEPTRSGFSAGQTRKNAMDALVPEALTASDDQPWQLMRDYNNNVLKPDHHHPGDARFLQSIQTAFPDAVTDFQDIQQGMGKLMLNVVFGDRSPDPALPTLIDELMDLIENPLRRRLQKRKLKAKREALFDHLRALWRESPPPDASLLSLGREHVTAGAECAYLDQIPHWMFTFVRSGSQWITRSLALILSSPEAYERCRAEAAAAWPQTGLDTEQELPYIQACMRETARLYPPVVWTFHRCPDGVVHEDHCIDAGTEILQVLTLWGRQRKGESFCPDNQLNPPEGKPPARDPLFLGGARCCPGRTLITRLGAFVIARQLASHNLQAQPVLSTTNLPFAIKDERLNFRS